MNNRFGHDVAGLCIRKGRELTISIVILLEVLAIVIVATYAWVEAVSSIKITNEPRTKGTVDTYVFTEAMLGKSGILDLAAYFKQAGDMHLAPASSADGITLFFPEANADSESIHYRQGNINDKNTSYLSATFKLKADADIDIFFDQTPTFSAFCDDIRVSVTSVSEGSTETSETKIYANISQKITTHVVNATNGDTGNTEVEAFSAHTKMIEGEENRSSNRLFTVGANETKIVTINIWLQKSSSDHTDLTNTMSQTIHILDFGITSLFTPRHITLIPTSAWDDSDETEYFYAWCWNDHHNQTQGHLYPLALDAAEQYSFDDRENHDTVLFIRSLEDNLTAADISTPSKISNQTETTSIPKHLFDATYIITTLDSGTENRSTGQWVDPAMVKVAYVTGQESFGTLATTSYIGTETSTNVMETTNSNSQKHKDMVHAWPGKKLKLTATPATDCVFVGWYDTPEATGTALSTDAIYEPNTPVTATDITYYAKFKEVRTLTIYKYVDNIASAIEAGTITIKETDTAASNEQTSNAQDQSFSQTFDKGTRVTFSAAAKPGYTLQGIYTDATREEIIDTLSPITLDTNTTYYASFTTNEYNVVAQAQYKTGLDDTYTQGDTGGTVQVDTNTSGANSIASVKYGSTVTLTAEPKDGYEFVGWYTDADTCLDTSASFRYTLNEPNMVTFYARFKKV